MATGAIMTPLFLTSTYVQDGVAQPRLGHEYARVTNPTRTALEKNLASLEGGEHGLAFASGLAAIEAILKANLSSGDHVVCGDNLYGGSERLFRFWERYGLRFDYVDTSDLEKLRAAIQPSTRMVYLETPTNPPTSWFIPPPST
jgi:cystathionine beta-lyase/cystathionine gamma-synthase